MELAEIISVIESFAPLSLQETYDNSGLAVGNAAMQVKGVLLCLDVTEDIVQEALQLGANLIISHHPVIFTPVKKLTGTNYSERIIISAIQHNIALYSAHTNIDNVHEGVNLRICAKLDLQNPGVLVPVTGSLRKLVTYVPVEYAGQVRSALFDAGAGHIGQYDQCSFNAEGLGSYRPLPGAAPFAGETGKFHLEKEIRIETIFSASLQNQLIRALQQAHPYEEVAYDIFRLENSHEMAGAGMIGTLKQPVPVRDFLDQVKSTFNCRMIRTSPLPDRSVQKIAVCGGSGAFLIGRAIAAGAEVFVTGDVKYHQFFEADGKIVIADIGHYESEQFTIEIFYELLTKNLPNFAVHFSRINTNCIIYL
jgi:dinuclear metal center YbgI/SA1388 family protein